MIYLILVALLGITVGWFLRVTVDTAIERINDWSEICQPLKTIDLFARLHVNMLYGAFASILDIVGVIVASYYFLLN